MAFTVDHSQASELKPEGKYEVIVDKMKPSFTRKNTPCLNLVLTIRNDVSNPAGGKLFTSLYKKKEPTAADRAVDGYSAAQIQAWCKAARIENGRRFESLEELCAALTGALVRVQLQHEEYNGRTMERVGPWPEQTAYPDCKHQGVNRAQFQTLPDTVTAQDFTELENDEDVPF